MVRFVVEASGESKCLQASSSVTQAEVNIDGMAKSPASCGEEVRPPRRVSVPEQLSVLHFIGSECTRKQDVTAMSSRAASEQMIRVRFLIIDIAIVG